MKNNSFICAGARVLFTVGMSMANGLSTSAQGLVTFNAHANWGGTNYVEQGVQFRVTGGGSSDRIYIMPANNYPYNATPWMEFYYQSDYLAFSLTNGNTFGLMSVALADLTVPSLQPFVITFNGFKADGSQVSMVFNTPGNRANSFETYLFDADFASGLTNVAIHANGWAMDNLAVTTGSIVSLSGSGAVTPVRFGPPTNFPAGSSPISLVVADFNRDGKPDLAVANNSVSLLFGLGNGAFTSPINLGSNYSTAIVADDFNNDGKLDIFAVGYYASIFLGDGNGNFVRTNVAGTYYSPKAVAIGDFNADGKKDLALVGNNISLILGVGNGNFNQLTNYYLNGNPGDVIVGDINDDGYDDLVFSEAYSYSSDACVQLGNGDGTFDIPQYYPSTPSGYTAYHDSLALADFNDDGKPDIAVLDRYANLVKIRMNNGEWFWTAKEYPVGFAPTSIVAGDFNGDGKIDLVVRGSSTIKVLYGNGDGSFTVGSPISVTSNSSGHGTMVTGDFNGDGLPDIAFVNNGSVAVMLNQTPPSMQITPMAGYNQLSWPAAFGAFTLEYTTNLSPPASWQPFPYPPVLIGNQKAVTDWTDGAQKFYRLKKP